MVIRQMETGEIIHTLNIKSRPVRSVSMATNGKITVAGGDR